MQLTSGPNCLNSSTFLNLVFEITYFSILDVQIEISQ